ncbi:AbrB/MazE/SpoVT family DNA-binding domain-containing protein [Candidatus Woesearchaeota archaeon]|nr:AbrB/MazE/SpoVT family DNA-binding domain-containing protein [Candidatus Woesearchaeota archaeon]
MRLQSQISREYKGTKYEKFWIVIPSKIIEKLGWKSKQELNADLKNNKLIIQKEDWED